MSRHHLDSRTSNDFGNLDASAVRCTSTRHGLSVRGVKPFLGSHRAGHLGGNEGCAPSPMDEEL